MPVVTAEPAVPVTPAMPVVTSGGSVLDQVAVTGLSATGRHGVFEHERREGQLFRCDVVLHLDTRAAAASDELSDTVNYGELSERVVAVLSGEPFDLIETVAERVARTCLRDSHVGAVDVTVHKPQAPVGVPFDDVSVWIRRGRTDLPSAPDGGQP